MATQATLRAMELRAYDAERERDRARDLNAELLARIVELERELAQPRAKRDLERPTLPSDDEIARARRAARDALVAQAAEHVAS